MKKKNKPVYPLIAFSLIFLFNPSLNIIDLTPDFIPYLVLASLISPAAEGLPYFREMKDSFRRLALLNIAKLGGVLIMFANLSTGSDIIPLFTLTFNALEVILLIGAVKNTSSALFYLGERSEAGALITPYRGPFGIKTRPETLRIITIVYCIVRGVISFLPEIGLLTYSNAKITYFFKSTYAPVTLSALAINTALGIVWLIFALCYLRSVRRQGTAIGAAEGIIDDERLEEIRSERLLKSRLGALTALFIASFFTFEIMFKETGDVSILPPFIYGIFIICIAGRLLSKKWQRISVTATSAGFCIISLISYAVKILFHTRYDYIDLYLRAGESFIDSLGHSSASRLYMLVCGLSVTEAVSFVAMTLLMAVGFVDFIKNQTALLPGDPLYSRQDRAYHDNMSKKGIALFVITALIGVTKCINVFLRGDVKLIFTEDSQTAQIIESSALPWFHYVYFALSVLLVFFSYFYLSELKNDIRMKHSGKRIFTEKTEETKQSVSTE